MHKRIPIWGDNIPGNSYRNKLSDMNIKGRPKCNMFLMLKFATSLKGNTFKDNEQLVDTFTYAAEIRGGHEKETYEDVPYLNPFPVKGSDAAIIIIPGGGYAYKTSHTDKEGKQLEGDVIARYLNQAGYNAFVLSYRSNPYEMPIPLLDVQRAIRYLKFHASEYGLDPEKIGLIGFSAGGYQACATINILRDNPVEISGYQEDDIDKQSAKVAAAGLIYPCINYRNMIPMMFSSFPAEDIRNEEKRNTLIEQYDNILYVQEEDTPQFVCCGTKDVLVFDEQLKGYINKLKKQNVSYRYLEIPKANHGVKAKYWMSDLLDWLKKIIPCK